MTDEVHTNSMYFLIRCVLSMYLGFEMKHGVNTTNQIFQCAKGVMMSFSKYKYNTNHTLEKRGLRCVPKRLPSAPNNATYKQHKLKIYLDPLSDRGY